MDFVQLLNLASLTQKANEATAGSAKRYSTSVAAPKRDGTEKPKGKMAAGVQAFLAKEEEARKAKDLEEEKKRRMELKKQKMEANAREAEAKKLANKEAVLKALEEKRLRMKEALQNPRKAKAKFDDSKANKDENETETSSTKIKDKHREHHHRNSNKSPHKMKKDFKTAEEVLSSGSSSDSDNEGNDRNIGLDYRQTLFKKSYVPSEEFLRQKSDGTYAASSKKHKKKKKKHKKERIHEDSGKNHKTNKISKQSEQLKQHSNKPKQIRIPKAKPNAMSFQDLISMAQKQVEQKLSKASANSSPAVKREEQKVKIGNSMPSKTDSSEVKLTKPLPKRPMTQAEKESWIRRHTPEYQHFLKHGGRRPGAKHDISDSDSEEESKKPSAKVNMSRPLPPGMVPPGVRSLPAGMVPPGSRALPAGMVPPGARSLPNTTQSAKRKVESAHVLQCRSSSLPEQYSTSKSKNRNKEQNKLESYQTSSKSTPADDGLSTWDRIYKKIEKHPKPVKRRPVLDSDEDEYDDEMDDFIDDEDDETENVSSYIKDIFGYDRNRYKHERDDDLHGMESSYTAQLREEKRSAAIGRQEDLEDIRMEEEEMRRKALLKKKAKKMRLT